RWFKVAIAGMTFGFIAILLTALPTGRYLADWLNTQTRWLVERAFGLEPERAEIDAYWQRKRTYDVESAHAKLKAAFPEYDAAQPRLIRFAGMDPDTVLLRWGNFDRTVMLPSTVYEPDDSGRSYRLRPKVRSIWIRNFPQKGGVKAFFQIPDTPEAPSVVS